MMKTIRNILSAFTLCTTLFFLAFPFVLEGKGATISNGTQDAGGIDKNIIDRKTLVNRRFQFSWSSEDVVHRETSPTST
jgi:hypothetical protein